jgi:hypothetical protein
MACDRLLSVSDQHTPKFYRALPLNFEPATYQRMAP